MFNKKQKYNIDIDTAGKMLENVFAACDTTPNRVPFDKIVLKQRLNLFTDNLFIILSIVVFIITFLAPLFFPHSSIFMSADAGTGRPMSVTTHEMTESSFSVSFDGAAIDIGASYMEGEDGVTVTASEYDRDTNTITFPYYAQEYNIFVYDTNGRCMHLLLSPRE